LVNRYKWSKIHRYGIGGCRCGVFQIGCGSHQPLPGFGSLPPRNLTSRWHAGCTSPLANQQVISGKRKGPFQALGAAQQVRASHSDVIPAKAGMTRKEPIVLKCTR
jgi:hypothetical protein